MSTYFFLCCTQCKTKAFATSTAAGYNLARDKRPLTRFFQYHSSREYADYDHTAPSHDFILLSEHDDIVEEYSDIISDDDDDEDDSA